MAFVERQASTSKGDSRPKGNGAPGNNGKNGKNDKQRLKTNALRRKQLNDELSDLQDRVNNFVSALSPCLGG